MLRFRFRLMAAAVLCLAALSAPAGAFTFPRAYFADSLQGTFTSHGTEQRACSTQDGASFTQSRTVDDKVTFRSTSPGLVRFVKWPGGVSQGSAQPDPYFRDHRMKGEIAESRTETLSPNQPCDPTEPASDCGQKTKRYDFDLFGHSEKAALFYQMANYRGAYYPQDPYGNCPLAQGERSSQEGWWGQELVNTRGARFSGARLFRKAVKTITMHGSYHGHDGADLSYTITLRRH
jgi:hypothetical protein